jgi:hypothetical protein
MILHVVHRAEWHVALRPTRRAPCVTLAGGRAYAKRATRRTRHALQCVDCFLSRSPGATTRIAATHAHCADGYRCICSAVSAAVDTYRGSGSSGAAIPPSSCEVIACCSASLRWVGLFGVWLPAGCASSVSSSMANCTCLSRAGGGGARCGMSTAGAAAHAAAAASMPRPCRFPRQRRC